MEKREWELYDERLGNDLGPYTLEGIYRFERRCNRENEVDPDYTPIALRERGNELWDVNAHVLVARKA
jgi:hypothetical protein